MAHQAPATPGLDLFPLLKGVSRSFYLTLRILPHPIRGQIGLAYLLARISDTLADSDWVPVEQRIGNLKDFVRHLQGPQADDFSPLLGAVARSSNEEKRILQRSKDCLTALYRLAPSDRELVDRALAHITQGQISDLERFPPRGDGAIAYLKTDAELDQYAFQVAGCVGEFWTRMCELHLKLPSNWDSQRMIDRGIAFGKGLQYVNILRDFRKDRELGRCYLPETYSNQIERVMRNSQGVDRKNEMEVENLFRKYLDRAQGCLEEGWDYTRRLPWTWVRVRLACSWPILIGLQTLGQMRQEMPFRAETPVKISRRDVKKIVFKTVCLYPFRKKWERLPGTL